MDNCKNNIEAISMLIDGELDDGQASELRAHISRCETCQRVYDAFSAISGSIGDDMVEPPEMLAKGVMFKINLMKQGGKKRFAYGRFTAIAACLALILFGANHFGLLSGYGVSMNARSKESAPNEVMEANLSTAGSGEAPAAARPEEHKLLEGFLEGFDTELDLDQSDSSAQAEPEGKVSQFGISSHPMDSTADAHSADETDFLLFLNGLIAYADENDPENTSEDFAFYRSGEEGAKDVPALLRIYQGKYERPIQSSATNILTNAGIRLPEPEPAAAFADLKSLRALESLLKDAEETDKTFEADPDYTIALFDSEGALMEKEVSPLLLWIHDGHLYFKTAPEAKIMRAAVKPDGLTEFLESFKNKA